MTMTGTMLSAWIDGIGILGPALFNWPDSRPILTGVSAYEPRPIIVPAPQGLPPAERRRTGTVVKVALAVAQQAIAAAQQDPKQLATVFSSSGADGNNCDAICDALASDDRLISPTRFHNSVHNAPAGYWGIASGAMTATTVLGAYDGSFGAGLVEAMAQVAIEGMGCLLVTYDAPYPGALNAKRPLSTSFGLALVLMPQRSKHSVAQIQMSMADSPGDTMADHELEILRLSVPSARGLPLLQSLARGESDRVVLEYLAPLSLEVLVAPCR